MKIKIKQGLNVFRFYFSFLLLFFYFILGFLFLFTNLWIDFLPKGRGFIGLFLVLFGALRFYIAYIRFKSKKDRIKALKEQLQIKKTTEETL